MGEVTVIDKIENIEELLRYGGYIWPVNGKWCFLDSKRNIITEADSVRELLASMAYIC